MFVLLETELEGLVEELGVCLDDIVVCEGGGKLLRRYLVL